MRKVMDTCPLCLLYPPDDFMIWLKKEKNISAPSAEVVKQYAQEFNNRK